MKALTIRAFTAALALFGLSGLVSSRALGEERAPNVVLIYADDVGYGDLGCYGATKVKTPNLDRLASQGLKFTDGHAPSATCTPSRYGLITGESPWRKPGTGILTGDAALIIKPGSVTLPSVMKQAGYATGVVGKWHLGLGQGNLNWNGDVKPGPLEIGFDTCFLVPATGDRVPCVYLEDHRVFGLDSTDPIQVSYGAPVGDEPTGREHPELLKMKLSHGHDFTIVNGISRIGYMTGGKSARWVDEDMADTLTRRATEFIVKNQKRPFFLYFATHDIHVPRAPHARFAGKSGCGVRGDVIEELDWCVGEILSSLESTGVARDTLVIFTSDNGPVIDDGYDDGAAENQNGHLPAGPLRGQKYSLYEGGTRVPFLVRWPARVKPGVSHALIGQIDLLASLASLLKQSLPRDAAPDSLDMLAALLGQSAQGREEIVEHANGLAFRRGQWKLIPANPARAVAKKKAVLKDSPGRQAELYDLAMDLGETKNVAGDHPDIVKEMTQRLEQIRQSRERP